MMFKNFWTKFLLFASVIGPGIITANMDNDAGGIATYSMAGSHTGFRLLWTLLPITVALIMVQEMSARMGVVTGKGLADLIREKFGLRVAFYTLFFLIFADLGNTMAEFAGIAASGEIFGVSKYITVPACALFVWLLVTKGDYKVVERVFMVGCLVYFSYIISGFIIDPNWTEIFSATINPNFSELKSSDLSIIVGLMGTSITPWMQFYVQSAVVEKGIKPEHLKFTKMDVFFGSITMSMVTFFIVITCAATLFTAGIHINTAHDAAQSLAPLAGKYASYLFAFGLFNASFFAAAILPLATSYYVCEGMGWESGIDKTFKEAPNFFGIFSALIIISAVMILIPNINLFNILIWSQVINGILIPIVLLFIINLCSDPDIMGEYANRPLYNFFNYAIVGLMLIANSLMFYFEFLK